MANLNQAPTLEAYQPAIIVPELGAAAVTSVVQPAEQQQAVDVDPFNSAL